MSKFPSHWQLVPLEEVMEVIIDYRGKTPKKSGHGIPLITAKVVKNGRIDTPNEYIPEESYEDWMVRGLPAIGDIVVTTEAPLGEVAQLDDANVALAQRIVTLRGKKTVLNNDFLLYLMQSRYIQDQLNARASGSTVRGIKQSELRKVLLPVPPEFEQLEIANHLKAIDKKIELNRQTNQTLEQIAQAIFKSWFVDFDPVRAKIAAREAFIQQHPEVTEEAIRAAANTEGDTLAHAGAEACELAAICAISGKTEEQLSELNIEDLRQLKNSATMFPENLVSSELGEVPEGWEIVAFGTLLSKTIGGDWGREEPDDKHTEKVRILRGTDLPNVYAGNDNGVPTRFVEAKKLASRKLIAGDIVIEVSGGSKNQPTGRSLYLLDEIIERFNSDLEPASFCRLFRPVSREAGLILGLHLQKIYADGETWKYQNQSTGISNFQTKVFLEKELVVVPSASLQSEFYNNTMPFLQKMAASENHQLATMRDSLLPKLLSGAISIANEVDLR